MTEDGHPTPGPPRPDSRVRDHLANERTFLAWIRTALGLVGIGFVLARMGLFLRQLAIAGGSAPGPESRGGYEYLITGVIFLLLGTSLGFGSGWLYHRSRRAIDDGRYEPARRAVTTLTVVVVAGSLAVTGLVVRQLLGP